MFSKRWSYLILASIVSINSSLLLPGDAAAQSCPIPKVGETSITLCDENQTEIPRGTCLLICIRGKMKESSLMLSIDQSTGKGFHFNQDNGPTTIETTSDEVLVCSDNTACGSASITINVNGEPIEMGSIRSDAGRWVYIGGVSSECPVTGEPTTRVEGGGVYQDELILGKWKIWEQKNVRYRCNLLINTGCDCSRCYDGIYCINPVPCPDGFDKISPFCCRQYPGNGTETIYCITLRYGPYIHEWRCN